MCCPSLPAVVRWPLPSPRYARAVPPRGNAFAVRRPSGPFRPGLVGARSLAISLFILGFPEMANTFGAYPPSHEEQVPPPNLVGIAMVVLLAIHGRCFAVTANASAVTVVAAVTGQSLRFISRRRGDCHRRGYLAFLTASAPTATGTRYWCPRPCRFRTWG